MIRVGVEAQATIRGLAIVGKQVAFATAQALNDTAFEARDTERNLAQGVFTIRRPWVLQGIQVARPFATRNNLRAVVEVEPKRDFLGKFEEGGIKRPTEGRTIAVPDDDAFPRSKVIPQGKRPK